MKNCPACGEKLSPSGECETCRRAAAILMECDVEKPVAAPSDTTHDVEGDDGWTGWQEASAQTVTLLEREFPPPATEFPSPMPPSLEDPARVLRWYLLGLTVLCVTAWSATVSLEERRSDDPPFLVTHGVSLALIWFLLSTWRLLPGRRPDVFYLRSFRHDENTELIRIDLVRAFGRGIRVTGIRDPNRRSTKWLRQLNQLVFALRYSTPKYLNLEAGDDWKERLWRSLTLARGAIVDVSDLTSYVQDEVRMCFRTLGLDRLLFVGNDKKTVAGWQQLIASILELPDANRIRVVIWSGGRTTRANFRGKVSTYAAQLPKRPPELSPAGSEVAFQDSVLRGRASYDTSQPWVEVIVGSMLAAFFYYTLQVVQTLDLSFKILICLAGLCVGVMQIRAYLEYLSECGSTREWLLVSLTMGFGLLALPAAAVAPGVQKVRVAAASMSSQNSLKQIGLAMHNYHDNTGYLPPATSYSEDGKPLLSWRVLILPYMEQGELYKQFKLDEPWDSPHNIQLVERMPKVFQHPMAGSKTPPGHTHYRVFVTPRDAKGPSTVFSDGIRPGALLASRMGLPTPFSSSRRGTQFRGPSPTNWNTPQINLCPNWVAASQVSFMSYLLMVA